MKRNLKLGKIALWSVCGCLVPSVYTSWTNAAVILTTGTPYLDFARSFRTSDYGATPRTLYASLIEFGGGATERAFNQVRFWGTYPSGTVLPSDNFVMKVYSLVGDENDYETQSLALRASVDLSTTREVFGKYRNPGYDFFAYSYVADVDLIDLSGPGTYFLMIANRSDPTTSTDDWAWAPIASSNLSVFPLQTDEGESVLPYGENYVSFELSVVPEPQLLYTVPVIALALAARRRRGRIASKSVDVQSMVRAGLDFSCRLRDAGVRHLVVGAAAVRYYGVSRPTGDVDLWVDPSPENVERLAGVLDSLNVPVAAFRDADGMPVVPGRLERGLDLRVDLLTALPKSADLAFETAYRSRERGTLDGRTCDFLSRQHLVWSKKHDSRSKDASDLKALGEKLGMRTLQIEQ